MKPRSLVLLVSAIAFALVVLLLNSTILLPHPTIDSDDQKNNKDNTILHDEKSSGNQQDQSDIIKDEHQNDAEQRPSSSFSSSSSLREKVIREDDALLLKRNIHQVNSPKPPSSKNLLKLSHQSCNEASSCLACLYRVSSSSSSSCVWLASREQCVESKFAKTNLPGVDMESESCPAILHQHDQKRVASMIPSSMNVVHVAIRKGGPEALIQLHLALVYWGFRTNLDSRKSKKQKGGPVVPFFKEMYSKEFARVENNNERQQQFRSHFYDYDHWQRSGKEGDVLIATETWKCRNDRTTAPTSQFPLLTEPIELRKSGVRYAQWHLTVWPRKPRSGCTILAHTRYIAEVFTRAPLLSVLFPYVSPHIVRFADKLSSVGSGGMQVFEKQKKKENNFKLLMYDGDMKVNPEIFNKKHNNNKKIGPLTVKKVKGYTPQQLYEEYARASVCVDWELPGGERFIYESALFGCCAIIDRSLNGLDREDFPLPDSLRVAPSNSAATLGTPLLVGEEYVLGTRKQQQQEREKQDQQEFGNNNNVPTLHEAIDQCTNPKTRPQTMKQLEPLRLSILQQRVRFHRNVRRYFSNNIHIVTAVASAEEFQKQNVPHFILTTLIALPFATIEIVLRKEAAKASNEMKRELNLLLDHSFLAAVLWTIVEDFDHDGKEKRATSFFEYVVDHSPSIITTSAARAGSVAFVRTDYVIGNRNFVHHLNSISSIILSTEYRKTLMIVDESSSKNLNFVFLSDARMFTSKNTNGGSPSTTTALSENFCRFSPEDDESKQQHHVTEFINKITNKKKKCSTENNENNQYVAVSLDDAENLAILPNKDRRLTMKNVVFPNFDKFLCQHAVYELMFPSKC